MPIKKSELYSSLWKSCDELRGGMDASLYKDYVLVLLFIKYISDKYAGQPYAPITIPEGASFADMIKLKGKTTIGDDINKKIIAPIAEANNLRGTIDIADFNNSEKLGNDKAKTDRLTNLIAIFENPALDFSKNRAENDDILGDAYEFLMRHFATESGKSKGQFYTPSEVSRILAKVVGINSSNVTSTTTVADITCGSGSLLLKVADEAERSITLYGQEMDVANAALARMNMILHNNPTAVITRENTLSNPQFVEGEKLRTFDFQVANPPFSAKSWTNGVNIASDPYGRFEGFGVPPSKNGDYAFLLHIIRSLKSKGKAAIILPHGVLFRGNAEAEIRTNVIKKGFIKGIIGLPANLFYGTGIPACIIVIDKENAENRKGIFMVDASKGFVKDGNKNRLREQDIHKIVDVFNKQLELPKFSRIVSYAELEQNEYNLNIPRYIDTQEAEDIQDIAAHLLGGIPQKDIDDLQDYWQVYKQLRADLFKDNTRKGYSELKIAKDEIKKTIFNHPEFTAFGEQMNKTFETWKTNTTKYLKGLDKGAKPKKVILDIAEKILHTYTDKPLIDKYDIYQHLMNYWGETMQDDLYEIALDGWEAGNEVKRIVKITKKNDKETKKEVSGIEGLEGSLIPPSLMIQVYFAKEQAQIDDLKTQIDTAIAKMDELREEHGIEDGLLAEVIDDKQKISKKALLQRIKELKKRNAENAEEWDLLQEYNKLIDQETEFNNQVKELLKQLEELIIAKYPTLTIDEIKKVVIQDKWMATIEQLVNSEMERISQRLTQRIKELAERYETTMPQLSKEVDTLETTVNAHLTKMGFTWK